MSIPGRGRTALVSGLRQRLASDGAGTAALLRLDEPRLDSALGGGLRAGLHEVCSVAQSDAPAAAGFALALLARLLAEGNGLALWVEQDFAVAEAGRLYGPGLVQLGLDPGRLLLASVKRPADALWAMEEGLRCKALQAAVGEFWEAPRALDLTATRRLNLRARQRGIAALVLHHGTEPGPSAALTRWRVRAHPGVPLLDDHGLGRTGFEVALVRNRLGPCGRWTVEWDPHARVFRFTASPLAMAASPCDRPHRAVAEAISKRRTG